MRCHSGTPVYNKVSWKLCVVHAVCMHSGKLLQQRLSADCEAYFLQASAVQGAERLTGTSRCGPERGAAIIFLGHWEGCSYSPSRSGLQMLAETTCVQTIVLGTN